MIDVLGFKRRWFFSTTIFISVVFLALAAFVVPLDFDAIKVLDLTFANLSTLPSWIARTSENHSDIDMAATRAISRTVLKKVLAVETPEVRSSLFRRSG